MPPDLSLCYRFYGARDKAHSYVCPEELQREDFSHPRGDYKVIPLQIQMDFPQDINTQESTLWNDIVTWWRGGNVDNEGSIWGEMVCRDTCREYDSFAYDYQDDICLCMGQFNPGAMWRHR